MSDWMKRILESKRAYRAKLAALPFEEKVRLLDKLRTRTRTIRAGRDQGSSETIASSNHRITLLVSRL